MSDRGRRTQTAASKKDDASFQSAMDDWYLDLVKKRRITPEIFDEVKRRPSLNSGDQVNIVARESNAGGSLTLPSTVNGELLRLDSQEDLVRSRSSNSISRIMKKVATDPRVLTNQKSAMTLTQWYDNEDPDPSATNEQSLAAETSSQPVGVPLELNDSSYRRHTLETSQSQHAADIMAQEIAMRVRLQEKIRRASELLEKEKNAQQNSVNEYLRISASISLDDRAQAQRIKSAFERRNQKSTAVVGQLNRKLDSYKQRIEELRRESIFAGSFPTPGTGMSPAGLELLRGLRNVSTNVRSGISEISGTIVSKPKVFAHMIRDKFGSADNIVAMKSLDDVSNCATDEINMGMGSTLPHSFRCHSDDDFAKLLPVGTENRQLREFNTNLSQSGSLAMNLNDQSAERSTLGITYALKTLQENHSLLDEQCSTVVELQNRLADDHTQWGNDMQRQKYRNELLEEKLNDLTENHQSEVTSIKQTLAVFEEKLAYQLDERIRDMQEMVEDCHHRLAKLETARYSSSVEGLDNTGVRRNVVKLINVGLSIIAVVLIVINLIINLLGPFLNTRSRFIVSYVCIATASLLWINWGYSRKGI